MQVSEIINILSKELMTNIPLEPQKYNDIIKSPITGNRYFMDDIILSICNITEIKEICSHIIHGNMIKNLDQHLFFDLDESISLSENILLIFENTNLDTNRTAQLINNFEKLEQWANKIYKELNDYSLNSELLKKDLKEVIQVTFSEDENILLEVLKNHNIFENNDQKQKALDIIDKFGEFRDENYNKLDELISEQISTKVANNVDNLNYQWYKMITDQELKIQRYDELKQHELFQYLF